MAPPRIRVERCCPICGEPCSVNRGHRVNKTCGQRRCFIELRRRQSIGKVPVRAHQLAREQRNARMQAVIGYYAEGTWTERDRQMCQVVWRYAYTRGYHAGRRSVTRKAQAA